MNQRKTEDNQHPETLGFVVSAVVAVMNDIGGNVVVKIKGCNA